MADPEEGAGKTPATQPTDAGEKTTEGTQAPVDWEARAQEAEKQLEATEKRRVDGQRFITQLQDEAKQEREKTRALEEKVAQLTGRMDQITATPDTPAPDPYELTDEQQELFNNDPAQIIRYLGQKQDEQNIGLQQVFVDVLQKRDAALDERLAQIVTKLEGQSPERLAWEPAISELRKNEECAGMDDATLIAMAKVMGKEPDYQYRGGPGTRAATPTEPTHPKVTDAARQKAKNVFIRITDLQPGNKEDEEKLGRLMVAWEKEQERKGSASRREA